MFKSFILRIVTPIIILLTLFGCVSPTAGLKAYIDGADGYQFLYPNGWIQVNVKNASEGVDVVFRDLIERSENLSVVISQVDKNTKLEDLGSPSDIGYRFMQLVNQNPNSQIEAELIGAEKKEENLQNYYLLEYRVKQPNGSYRHNIAAVATKNGKLYTFNISTTEERWPQVETLFKTMAKSFSLS
ncbi:MAG: photosystem II reaction center PsbP [Geminocystis sp.]|nr:photosystem II reaction center PsbP [Geminocystis sp.]HIK36829.1 photosystem II reaction center PsbP family protein [Geminocystis sp. M7585_C2015_104]MCS7148059.1 photosystem II reaction center PsbP [Geminocystis sp.]MCX8077803.1 photosystem II reaction center PsbP [Geminocystis sp.]MDW8116411.1 photosystem II reaction center PsbP [Geminocystis sp.]